MKTEYLHEHNVLDGDEIELGRLDTKRIVDT